MPLLTVPREMVSKILMALAPDYAAICRAVQTCTVLRDMEAADKEVLWKHMCETLITAQAQSAGPYTTPAFAPRVMALETQAHLVMDSKAAVRLNHGHVRFGLPGTINAFTVQALEDEFGGEDVDVDWLRQLKWGKLTDAQVEQVIARIKKSELELDAFLDMFPAEPQPFDDYLRLTIEIDSLPARNIIYRALKRTFAALRAVTVQALEDEFDFLLEVQYRDPCQNFAAPLSVLNRTVPDRSLVIGTDMDWITPAGWSTTTGTFNDVLRVVLLARDKMKNAITTVLIGFDAAPYDVFDLDVTDNVVIFTFQCAVNEAWGMVRDKPDEIHVFAHHTPDGFTDLSVEIWSTTATHLGQNLGLYDLANVVRSRQMSWIPCA